MDWAVGRYGLDYIQLHIDIHQFSEFIAQTCFIQRTEDLYNIWLHKDYSSRSWSEFRQACHLPESLDEARRLAKPVEKDKVDEIRRRTMQIAAMEI